MGTGAGGNSVRVSGCQGRQLVLGAGNFQESMRVTLEKMPSNGGHKVHSGLFLARKGFQWRDWIIFG